MLRGLNTVIRDSIVISFKGTIGHWITIYLEPTIYTLNVHDEPHNINCNKFQLHLCNLLPHFGTYNILYFFFTLLYLKLTVKVNEALLFNFIFLFAKQYQHR